MNLDESPTAELCREYAAWNAAQGLKLGSADEHHFDEALTPEQRTYVRAFSQRWDAAVEQEAAWAAAEEEEYGDGCKHSFVCSGTAYGGDDASYHGEGRSYCEYCGADGDA